MHSARSLPLGLCFTQSLHSSWNFAGNKYFHGLHKATSEGTSFPTHSLCSKLRLALTTIGDRTRSAAATFLFVNLSGTFSLKLSTDHHEWGQK